MNKSKKNKILNFKFLKNTKAYIGAIGDDLPSLIPIFIGLSIFFAVFLNTYNIYKDNTDIYSLQNEAIKIANIIKEEPLISDWNAFNKNCNRINTKYNWNAFLVDLDLNSENQTFINKIDLTDESLIKENMILDNGENIEKYFRCFELEDFKNNTDTRDTTIYMFPITVQKTDFVYPARLYVAVWN